MNKRELIDEVSGKVGITKKGAGNVIDAIVETITNALKKGEKGSFSWFWHFSGDGKKSKKRSQPPN